MDTERSTRMAVAFARGMSRAPQTGWCGVCVDFLSVSGAGITIMAGDSGGPLCASSDAVGALEDVQYTAGEGPCHDAFATGRSVHAVTIDPTTAALWPTFALAASEQGIGAVSAYPLTADGAKVGVLSLYRTSAGALTDDQHADSLAIAGVLTETVLGLQDAAPPGSLAVEIDDVVGYRAEIHQASGIVAVQLGLSPADALVRIRAHAFGSDQPLDAVASAIVGGRFRLDDDLGASDDR